MSALSEVQPSMSPDFSSLHFYIRRHLKALVYSVRIDNEDTLYQRISDACQTIRNLPGNLDRVRQSMIRRVNACNDSGGGHFEHFL
jgi:hypothetical protein